MEMTQEQKDRMENLRRELYYCDGDSDDDYNEVKNHKGFIGEAYQRVAKLYKENRDAFEEIAHKELMRLNNEQTYGYERDIYDDVYTVKFTYFYASQCCYIYKKTIEKYLEDKGCGTVEEYEEYIKNKKDGFKIISVGAGNLVDYWGLEAALFLLGFSDETIKNIQYKAYEIDKWGCKGMDGTSPSDGISRIMNYKSKNYKIQDKNYYSGKEDGNFFNIEDCEADIIFFPNSFNELNQQNHDEFPKVLAKLKSKRNDTFVAITYHTGETDDDNAIEEVFTKAGFMEFSKIDWYAKDEKKKDANGNVIKKEMNNGKKKEVIKTTRNDNSNPKAPGENISFYYNKGFEGRKVDISGIANYSLLLEDNYDKLTQIVESNGTPLAKLRFFDPDDNKIGRYTPVRNELTNFRYVTYKIK